MRRPARLISHWYSLVEGLQASSLEFYKAVEAGLGRRKVPDIETSRVDWREGGVLSAKREYLRVSRGRLAFDVCAAPFGQGFFFSWWLTETETPHAFLLAMAMLIGVFLFFAIWIALLGTIFGIIIGLIAGFAILWGVGGGIPGAVVIEDALLATPVVGWLYERLFRPETFYRYDTMLLFQESVRKAVLEVIDGLMNQQGLRSLSEQERQPRLKDLALK